MNNRDSLKRLDNYVGVITVGLFIAYLFIPNTTIAMIASLLFIYWIGLDTYINAVTRSYDSLALDLLFIGLIAYAIYNPHVFTATYGLVSLMIMTRVARVMLFK